MIQGLYKCFQHWSANGAVWLYSDPHFGDSDCKLMDPNWPDPDEQVKRINAKVGRKDTLILLGDVGDIEYAAKLRGYKVLICGNHDMGHSKYEEIFDEVYSGPLVIGEKLILSHEPLFDVNWVFNIHGHVHRGCPRMFEEHLNVCANVIGYAPVSLNQFIKKSGALKKIQSIHRQTIDKAIAHPQQKILQKIGSD